MFKIKKSEFTLYYNSPYTLDNFQIGEKVNWESVDYSTAPYMGLMVSFCFFKRRSISCLCLILKGKRILVMTAVCTPVPNHLIGNKKDFCNAPSYGMVVLADIK